MVPGCAEDLVPQIFGVDRLAFVSPRVRVRNALVRAEYAAQLRDSEAASGDHGDNDERNPQPLEGVEGSCSAAREGLFRGKVGASIAEACAGGQAVLRGVGYDQWHRRPGRARRRANRLRPLPPFHLSVGSPARHRAVRRRCNYARVSDHTLTPVCCDHRSCWRVCNRATHGSASRFLPRVNHAGPWMKMPSAEFRTWRACAAWADRSATRTVA